MVSRVLLKGVLWPCQGSAKSAVNQDEESSEEAEEDYEEESDDEEEEVWLAITHSVEFVAFCA